MGRDKFDWDFEDDKKDEKSSEDSSPVFWNGMVVGTTEDLRDGKIDPTNTDKWR